MAKNKIHVKFITLKGKGKELADNIQTMTMVAEVIIDEEMAFDTHGVPDGESPKAVAVDAVSFVIDKSAWLSNRKSVLDWFKDRMVGYDLTRTNYFENGKKRVLESNGKPKSEKNQSDPAG